MNTAFIFPGQGSQYVGMGKEIADAFPEARHVFQEVDDVLGQHLSKLIFEGPAETLTLTENTQPALMATSLAILKVLEKQGGKPIEKMCQYVAGHSLGEYSALASVRSFSLADTARLLRTRGQAMQRAVPPGKGGMAALLGVEFDVAAKIAEQASVGDDICQAANDNGGGQVVLSGTMAAIERALVLAPDLGVKRAMKLPVSAPFHSSLMQPAADVMEKALAVVTISPPVVPLVANVTADIVTAPDMVRHLLVQQVTGTVRWRESMLKLKEKGVARVVEIGAGKVLSGLAKRIDKDMEAISIQIPADLESFLGG